MTWIKMTDPLGNPVWLCVEQLVRIRQCLAGIDFPAPDAKTPDTKTARDRKSSDMPPALAQARSIIDLVTGGVQAVRETQDEILERIRGAGKQDDNDKVADV
jgi:hypothetical protein